MVDADVPSPLRLLPWSLACCCLLLIGWGRAALAQVPVYDVVYRPPGIEYRVLRSRHFDLIFQEEAAASAREVAGILEETLPATRRLVGLRRPFGRMPVVLNAFNDRSNGFVTPFPFKQEIEEAGIKGSVLSTRFPSWLMAVAPHELAHAVHAEISAPVGVGWGMRLFAPDWSRWLNFTTPPGLTEGLAVYRESHVVPGAGRLHAPLFTMKYWAAMGSEDPWRLAEMLERPAYTYPFDRFYIGGAHLFAHLAGAGGSRWQDARFFRRAARFYNRFPFFGYGVALWYATGEPPFRLGAEVRAAAQAREEARREALGPLTRPTVVATAPGLLHRRPRWLNDTTLVAYVRGYDVRPGFYRIDARSGRRAPIRYQSVTEDYYYSFSADSSALYFARYVPDPLVTIQATAEVYRLDLASRHVSPLTRGGRVLAPVPAPGGGLWALRNEGPFNQWVRIDPAGNVRPEAGLERARFVQLAPSPSGHVSAVLLNAGGHQGLFRAERTNGAVLLGPWLVFEDASVYDADWSADGRYLFFSADPGGVANVYAFDTRGRRLLRLTNVLYGALEPSLSPDGRTLAFVNYRHERYDLVRMPFEPAEAEVIPHEAITFGEEWRWRAAMQLAPDTVLAAAAAGTQEPAPPYRAWQYLAPRMAYPTIRYDEDDPLGAYLGPSAGLAVAGADPLERWAYRAEAFYQARRLWGEAFVQTGRYLLRPSLTLYNRPYNATAAATDEAGRVVGRRPVGVEERGAALGLRLPVTLRANVFQSYARFFLEGAARQTRLIDQGGAPRGSFRSRLTLTPSAFFGYRLQANPHDLVPNTGLALRAFAEVDAWTDGVAPGRAFVAEADLYLPFLKSYNAGLRIGGGVLTKNRGSLLGAGFFLPRGYEGEGVGAGTYLRLGLEHTLPLWYVDSGSVLLPVYLKALYAYGFAQTLQPAEAALGRRRSSVGVGLGLEARLFSTLDVELRLAGAYRVEDRTWALALR